jgi:undecaprenyl-diphosphatase
MDVYQFDQAVFRLINSDLRSPAANVIFFVLSWMGLGGAQAAFALTLLVWHRTKNYTLPLLLTILVAGLPVAQLIKRLIPRERPSLLAASTAEEAWKYNSFPSGHTSTSFGVATMIWLLTRGTRYAIAGPIALTWAFLVGVSRVYRGVHWPSDVLAGACGGIFSACLVYLLLTRAKVKLTPSAEEAQDFSASK